MMEEGYSPRVVLRHLAPSYRVPPEADDMMLWRLIVSMIDPPKRKKLLQYNTIEDAVELINRSKRIIVLSGAGISTSAGLPDFRSRNGIYVQIHAEHPDLKDPKSMFDINYFRKNPRPFYQFAKALYPGQYKPTIGHKFIKCIEDQNKLLRNYSQNIDTLEKQAGIKRVVECHGSFAKASCTNCGYEVDGDAIRADIFNQKTPLCPKCHDHTSDGPKDGLGVMKPNIVFFGEQLGGEFHNSLHCDKEQADLLIVIGSSLKVRPVALIPQHVSENVPQILINKEPLDHMGFDIELLGNCDDIIQELCLRLGDGWTNICESNKCRLSEIRDISSLKVKSDISIPIERKDESYSRLECKLLSEQNDSKAEESKTAQDDICMVGPNDDSTGEMSSFKSNLANAASESTEHNMIDDSDEAQGLDGNKNQDGRAISDCDQGSDSDWEDVEILPSCSDSSDSDLEEKVLIEVPESSFFFLSSNKYLFQGAELSKAQLASYTKDLQQQLDDRNKPLLIERND